MAAKRLRSLRAVYESLEEVLCGCFLYSFLSSCLLCAEIGRCGECYLVTTLSDSSSKVDLVWFGE